METNDLIKQMTAEISADRKPVSAEGLLAIWFVLGGMFGGFFLWQMGLTPDLLSQVKKWDYVAGLFLLVIAYILSTVLSLKSAQPGAVTKTRGYDQLLGFMILASLSLYGGLFSGNAAIEAPVWEALACCLRISFGALLPNLAAAMIVSRLAPIDTRRIVKYSMISSMLLISIVSQLNCPVTDFSHIMTGHGIFLLISAGLTYSVYLFVFKLTANAAINQRLGNLAGLLKAKIS